MAMQIGATVRAEMMGLDLTVRKKLGEGGQGAVYLVEGEHGPHALKWYNHEQATPEQRKAIRDLATSGPARGPAGQRFIWPQDVVSAPGTDLFGYLMPLIDTARFAELGEVWARRKPAPGFRQLCEISYQAANSYRALHLSGYCYRDISAGNLMFDPKTGETLICDNDNVGVNRQSTCQVRGTMPYMAPELVRGEADPSTETDLHSLAVLLFHLWVWHHPLHGQMEYQLRSWDFVSMRIVYGKSPVFTFDPQDACNRLPKDPEYETAARRWGYCPSGLRKLFLHAFTVGLHEPAHRVTEGQWQELFLQLKDGAIDCPDCQAANLWEAGLATLACWHCCKPIALPPRLVFSHPTGRHALLLTRGARVLQRHVDPHSDEERAGLALGEVVQNPANPQVWGLRNQTAAPWTAQFPDGQLREIPPQRAVPLNASVKIHIAGAPAEIIA